MAQVDNLNTVQTQFEFLGELHDALVITKQYWLANTLGLSLHCSFEHSGVNTLGEYHSLWMAAGSIVELLSELGLLSEQLAQAVLVCCPVLDFLAGNTTFDGSLSHCCRHLGDESWVNRLRDEIVASECKVVHVIYIVHHVGHRLLGEVGDGMYGSQLHLLVDSGGMHVERTTEYVWESDYVVNLVGIVRASC